MLQLIAFAVLISWSHAIVCPPNLCDTVDCTPVTNCNGNVVTKGGFCGCCDVCLASLDEGDFCGNSLLLGVPSLATCEPPLICDVHTMRCRKHTRRASLTCAEKKDQLKESSTHLLGAPQLDCNPDGSYKPKQCQGSQCYCVDSNGQDLGYHTNSWEAQSMNCQCARDFNAYKKTGLIGRLFYCASNGNYHE